jgi:PKD repeat protein
LEFLIMERPPSVLVIALVSAVSGLVFLANSFTGNNWLINSILSPPLDSQGLLPIANAIGKDLMLDVSPQLHPSTVVGESAKQIKFQHWIDNDIHCEDCLRLDIPNNGKKAGAAFSSDGAVYNFEEAKKIRFYVMGEEAGAKVNFKAVGNDKGNNAGGGGNNNNSSNNKDLFTNQEFALTSQNVTLNQTWNYLEMNLEGVQQKLTNVKYPFGLEVAQGKGQATTIIYVKGISYSSEPVQEQYLLEPSSANTTASTLAMTAATIPGSLNVTLLDNTTETVNAPATVEFNATVSNGQEPYSFDWDFKDGAMEAMDTDGNLIHTFATPGSYNVTVNVADSLNNTGSANTLVDVAENLTIDDEPAIVSEDNSSQDSQATTGALNTTNTTSPDADTDIVLEEDEAAGDTSNDNSTGAAEDEEPPGVIEGTNTDDDDSTNDTETNSTDTGTGIDTESNSGANNSPPIANAGNDLIGKPNEQVILDASKSSDPDAGDTILSYQWQQESGPAAEINDPRSPTPIVTLPNVDEDSTIVFSLTANDGIVDSEEKDTVSILVDYVDELTNDVQQRVLKPADITASEWTPSEGCEEQGDAGCLSDGSDATFVAAETENIDSINLYSFGEFSEEGAAAVVDPNSLVIERVVAEITAKKLGNTGYMSFAVDDPREGERYFTPSISIASNSFQKYNQVWDRNPVTGEQWTYDSLNSLTAGFKYDIGQSGVQISELQLTVSYHLPEPVPEPAPEPAPSSDLGAAEDNVGSEANENEENGENGTNGAQDADQEEQNEQEEPAIGTDTTDSNGADANDVEDEGSGESEE